MLQAIYNILDKELFIGKAALNELKSNAYYMINYHYKGREWADEYPLENMRDDIVGDVLSQYYYYRDNDPMRIEYRYKDPQFEKLGITPDDVLTVEELKQLL